MVAFRLFINSNFIIPPSCLCDENLQNQRMSEDRDAAISRCGDRERIFSAIFVKPEIGLPLHGWTGMAGIKTRLSYKASILHETILPGNGYPPFTPLSFYIHPVFSAGPS